jgi:sulfur-oxidizing protein SoxX
MRNSAISIAAGALTLLLGGALVVPAAQAQGKAPTDAVCNDKENPPKDAVTQGGCVVINRTKGNCQACHAMAGVASAGDIAPPLVSMKQRFPDKNKLRDQISDARKVNPKTVMPPFGPHKILSDEEINKVVEFVLTL